MSLLALIVIEQSCKLAVAISADLLAFFAQFWFQFLRLNAVEVKVRDLANLRSWWHGGVRNPGETWLTYLLRYLPYPKTYHCQEGPAFSFMVYCHDDPFWRRHYQQTAYGKRRMILRAKYLTYWLDDNTNRGNSYGMTWVMFWSHSVFLRYVFQSLEQGLLSYEALPSVLQLCPTVSFSCKAGLTSSHAVLSCFVQLLCWLKSCI